jgi:hypothetical protein
VAAKVDTGGLMSGRLDAHGARRPALDILIKKIDVVQAKTCICVFNFIHESFILIHNNGYSKTKAKGTRQQA